MKGVLPLVRGQIRSRTPGGRSVNWAATGRSGGASRGDFASGNLSLHVGDDPVDVRANAEQLRTTMEARALHIMNAEHGARVHSVESVESHTRDAVLIAEPGDGLLTVESDVALAALGADCSTFLVTDGRVLAVGHCGWRGLAVGLPGVLLRAARDYVTSQFEDAVAVSWSVVVGPTICGKCYHVPQARRDELSASAPGAVAAAALGSTDSGIDVRAGVHAALQHEARALGHSVSITDVPLCTYEEESLFSYRRDHRTGRQSLVASFASTPDEVSQFADGSRGVRDSRG